MRRLLITFIILLFGATHTFAADRTMLEERESLSVDELIFAISQNNHSLFNDQELATKQKCCMDDLEQDKKSSAPCASDLQALPNNSSTFFDNANSCFVTSTKSVNSQRLIVSLFRPPIG